MHAMVVKHYWFVHHESALQLYCCQKLQIHHQSLYDWQTSKSLFDHENSHTTLTLIYLEWQGLLTHLVDLAQSFAKAKSAWASTSSVRFILSHRKLLVWSVRTSYFINDCRLMTFVFGSWPSCLSIVHHHIFVMSRYLTPYTLSQLCSLIYPIYLIYLFLQPPLSPFLPHSPSN